MAYKHKGGLGSKVPGAASKHEGEKNVDDDAGGVEHDARKDNRLGPQVRRWDFALNKIVVLSVLSQMQIRLVTPKYHKYHKYHIR